ncbi:hypothetical protein ABZX85_38230 [Streptomyces sp. NPDC004539]|uniref:hypothetical protein n=1 Tax=Streptomyces sp. NPDC004539 TaxID=3154280 RepID=UPI00339E66D0
MKASVVDTGSNPVRLMAADMRYGVPLPVHTAKWRPRLSEQVVPDGRQATEMSLKQGAAEPPAFTTAVVRVAP